MAQVKKPQPSTRKTRKPTASNASKPKSKSKDVKRPPPKQVKTKPATTLLTKSKKAKKPKYTEAQLKLPAVNSIVPASAAAKTGKGAGKKRNKAFVDDTESMMTILAMVNAEKEGQIESKVLKARQMEEIREARRKEAEKRAEGKKGRLEEVKMGLKRRKGRDIGMEGAGESLGVDGRGKGGEEVKEEQAKRKKRKSVSFAS